ncbi:MAG: DUF429 domain-containing protein [Thermodesulfobacteriota bacterium]
MSVLSVDLAYKSYADVGSVALSCENCTIECEFCELYGEDPPTPAEFVDNLCHLSDSVGARVLLLDGPQGWKHPDNGLEHSRLCERELNTPAKTGLPGNVKPANYTPFVEFSIEVYQELTQRGWHLFDDTTDCSGQRVLMESFPMSAWRVLGIQPLPSKRKATGRDIIQRFGTLQSQFRLRTPRTPSHDELQALVSGLGGIAFELGAEHCLQSNGRCPELLDGTWREGFIVNPRPAALWPEEVRK